MPASSSIASATAATVWDVSRSATVSATPRAKATLPPCVAAPGATASTPGSRATFYRRTEEPDEGDLVAPRTHAHGLARRRRHPRRLWLRAGQRRVAA